MSERVPTTDIGSAGILFVIATMPARLVSWWHGDLRDTLSADAATFGRPLARVFFALLALIAVAYPVAASIVHAVGPEFPRAEFLTAALRPFFDIVYSESLPFMIAAAGIGIFCPALGVLFMALFIPGDLMAAGRSTTELQPLQKFGSFPAPHLARAISYALLWILAVEIPIWARVWATGWAGRYDGQRSVIASALARIGATAVLVYFWARALPWLIHPVFTWTPRQFTPEASNPTWRFWPILVAGTAVIAAVAAIWLRPAVPSEAPAGMTAQPAGERSMGQVLVRQSVAVVVLAALLAGLMTNLLNAVMLITGLVVAGPVLTVVLPRVRVPSVVADAPMAARWVAAMVIGLGVRWVIVSVVGDAAFENYLGLVLTLAVGAPLFRLFMEVGAGRPGGDPEPGPPPGALGSPNVSTILLLALFLFLIFPSVAWAHDCPSPTDGSVCQRPLWASLSGAGAAWWAASQLFKQTGYKSENVRQRYMRFWGGWWWDSSQPFRDVFRRFSPPSTPPPAGGGRNPGGGRRK